MGTASFPAAPIASMLFPGNAVTPQADGKSFLDKWQEILSAFQGSEGSMTKDRQAIVSKSNESTSTPSTVASEMRSTGQSDLHAESLDRCHADNFCAPKPLGLSAHISVAAGPNLKSVIFSNPRRFIRSKGKALSKDIKALKEKGVRSAGLRHADESNPIAAAAVSGFIQFPSEPVDDGLAFQPDGSESGPALIKTHRIVAQHQRMTHHLFQ